MNRTYGDICPAGHFCVEGTHTPQPCPNGTYSPNTGLQSSPDCLLCDGGKACTVPGLTKPNKNCSAGFYCELGATTTTPTDGVTGDVCPVERFCPVGTVQPFFCDDGFYMNHTQADACEMCPESFYCPNGTLPLECYTGHFCPRGTGYSVPPCPEGSFSPDKGLASKEECQTCGPGKYCKGVGVTGATALNCDPGYYCVQGVNVPNPEPGTFNGVGGVCPHGYYCPAGTSHYNNHPCPVGTFVNKTHQASQSDCDDCSLGHYCGSKGLAVPTGTCYAGFFCLTGSKTPTPDGSVPSEGAPCTPGHFCPNGTSTPIACRAGTYNPNHGEAECFSCPAGYYCLETSTTYNETVCPVGHYCPTGTSYPQQSPCPAGTFLDSTGGQSESDCIPCTPGKYCPISGLENPVGDCSAGWYCRRGSWSDKPVDLGNTTNEGCYCSNVSIGGKCMPGFYCPGGSSEPISCDLGYYCDNPGLPSPQAKCSAGYYCLRGATKPNPTDGMTGDACPKGRFCPEGTHDPELCPRGTFSNAEQLSTESQCQNCTAGQYCSSPGLLEPDGNCTEGYYCPPGQQTSSPFQYECPPGYYCPVGSPAPELCEGGSYQSNSGQGQCLDCPSGYYCDFSDAPLDDFSSFVCPRGYYCPVGTSQQNDFPCPSGTYGQTTGLQSEGQCVDCPARRYCEEPGRTNPGPLCSAGFYCVQRANSSTPTDGVTGNECPAGQFCEEGTSVPVDCPRGRYAATGGRVSATDCTSCDEGSYCNGTGLISPTDLCDSGYYCDGGADTPTQHDCPEGHFCERGPTSPTPCLPGSYMLSIKAFECDVCPPAFFCTPQDGIDPVVCPAGFYCPEGTGVDKLSCPPGTYGHDVGLSNEQNCTQCDAGQYCDSLNATAPSGPCRAGYFCTVGSDTPTPEDGFTGTAGACPEGFYCEIGSTVPTPCPEGTFSNVTHLEAESECTLCLEGRYCEAKNLTEPSGDCAAGFYCTRGAKVDTPQGNDGTGGPCFEGHYCPVGTAVPIACNAGTYNPLEQQSECFKCPAGYYCPANTTIFQLVCPQGFYCPNGTKHPYEFPCPKGTYNALTQQTSVDDCVPCPPGKFCKGEGLDSPSGDCAEGWYCTRGAWSEKPTEDGILSDLSCFCSNVSTGGKCYPGTYCPRGSDSPQSCDAGHYCNETGLANVTGPCAAGFYCEGNATTPTPRDGVTGNVCPAGHYCNEGTHTPDECPIGTFSNSTGQGEQSDCLPCTAGYYCPTTGLVESHDQCDGGYYCPEGQSEIRPRDYECTPGHHCPVGSPLQRPCPSGEYQDEFGRAQCKPCPAGYYCDGTLLNTTQCDHGVSHPVSCPVGHYCLPQTKFAQQHPCPSGTYNDREGLQNVSECTSCSPGKFCASAGLDSPTGNCSAGYYCLGDATSPTPTDGNTGDICPTGYYCPEGSYRYLPCEPGYFNPTEGIRSKLECLSCTAGKYCNAYGLSSPTGNCSSRYYCLGGTKTSTPTDGVSGNVCPEGSFCPEGSPNHIPCLDGTYSNQTLSETCQQCPLGFYCVDGSSQPLLCPSGFYCPAGTGRDWKQCPTGTFNPNNGLEDISQCRNCTSGNYCAYHNSSSPTGICEAGYYCVEGSDTPTPDGSSKGDAGVCPPGAYCPPETGNWYLCPRGTFSNQSGLHDISQCVDCLYGQYCDKEGLTSPSGDCLAGYYCKRRSEVMNPSITNVTGGPCPKGHFCVAGTANPRECEAGSYNPFIEASSCRPCPGGYFCPRASISYEDNGCPRGHYCPPETQYETQYPCPNGTYLNHTNANSSSQCTLCPPGHYCQQSGLAEPNGLCSAGWFCTRGSYTPKPMSLGNETTASCVCPVTEGMGGKCLKGTYCPVGSDYPIDCPPGFYCGEDALPFYSGPCLAGYFCNSSAIVSNPVNDSTGAVCPPGHYCPLASGYPRPCPPGTFSRVEGNQNRSDCKPCTAGSFCAGYGNAEPDGKCGIGYYCPGGDILQRPPAQECLPGHLCPEGSGVHQPCESGTYQPNGLMGECLDCPAGYYCDRVIAIRDKASGDNATSHGVTTPLDCPKGHYCPLRTRTAFESPCPSGTYSNITNAESSDDCLSCPPGQYCKDPGSAEPSGYCSPGFYCVLNATTPSQADNDTTGSPCPLGHYCPEGSGSPNPCPDGTIGPTTHLQSEDSCAACPGGEYCSGPGLAVSEGLCYSGYYCISGSIKPNPYNETYGAICPPGHYCPAGSDYPERCPTGTYQPYFGRTNDSECIQCKPGKYCNGTGLATWTGDCAEGFYCIRGSAVSSPQDSTGDVCPIGHFCPLGSSAPSPCQNGTYSDALKAVECQICPRGKFCVTGSSADPCLAGHYCPLGTKHELMKCPAGTYSPLANLSVVDQCTHCDPGKFCHLPGQTNYSGLCSAGFYCSRGADTRQPTGNHTGVGAECPLGSSCPEGSAVPVSCSPGTYADRIGQSSCTLCEAGYFCLSNAKAYLQSPCPAGYYCPRGTRSAQQYPCPTGTYNPENGSTSDSACLPCPPGKYCEGEGLQEPTGQCSPGWYCTGGSFSDKPTVSSNVTLVSECSCPAINYTGGKCWKGSFCPRGSDYPTDCTLGMYCGDEGLEAPSGPCAEGFYCNGSAYRPDPPGQDCPAGHYCPNGTAVPYKCPEGHSLSTKGNTGIENCEPCTPGWYCSGEGLASPTDKCSAGYYCPEGQTVAQPDGLECPKGHFCIVGTDVPEPCLSGTYQDMGGASYCKECLAGKYCDNTEANKTGCLFRFENSHGVVVPSVCPVGHYCVNGSSSAYQYPCPRGTFSNKTGLVQEDQCQDCLPGEYCGDVGLIKPSGPCQAGYVCIAGASITNPTDGITGYVCPVGSYCPRMSSQATLCPNGTFSNWTGLREEQQCVQCTPGQYCLTRGLTEPTGPCTAGYYCTLGAILPDPVDEVYGDDCWAGHYCEQGSSLPEKCPSGTYLPTTGARSVGDCILCEAGKFCLEPGKTNVTGNCNPGYFCIEGANNSQPRDGKTGNICPIGSFCPEGSAFHQTCPVTSYMDQEGAEECYPCPERHYCPGGEQKVDCPEGRYCPAQTGVIIEPCPIGTFSNSRNLKNDSECTLCSSGNFCDSPGQTNVTGLCAKGYFCTEGVDTSTPSGLHRGEGGVCPIGHYCPEGSPEPQSCLAGTYNNLSGQAECFTCPAGFFCLENSVTYEDSICPSGFYCLDATKHPFEYPCPPGTYNNVTYLNEKASCLLCPPGEYCAGAGLSTPTGKCAEGWYCTGGSSSPQPQAFDNTTVSELSECSCPALNYTGGKCWPGTFCPKGSSYPVPCTIGFFCSRFGLAEPDGLCGPGYYCNGSASRPDPPEMLCPPGQYCPEGSDIPIGCPRGTFSNSTGLMNATECRQCTPGYYCDGVGLVQPSSQCSAGFYCPSGQSTPTPDSFPCPKGHVCVRGTAVPLPCRSGTYQPAAGSDSCLTCPAGYYCDRNENSMNSSICLARFNMTMGVLVPAVCLPGYYCPNGTEFAHQYPCPQGTYSNETGLYSDIQCFDCPPGSYCGERGLVAPSELCAPGFYCDSRAQYADPEDGLTGDRCPQGMYCPEGSSFEGSACPKGTYSNATGLHEETQCTDCTPGYYCETEGLTEPTGLCYPGFYCSGRATEPDPVGQVYGDVCLSGHYCPEGTALPFKCPQGTYLNVTGQRRVEDCTDCDGGKFCGRKGLTSPSGDCDRGYFCSGRSNTSTPTDGITGDVCFTGHFCESGATSPSPCPHGSYVNHTKSHVCYDCPEGYHCVRGFTPDLCPAGYFCPGSNGYDYEPCPAGTFSVIEKLSNASECTQCLGGQYCSTPGQTNVTGDCDPGYYCEFGSDTATPTGNHTGHGGVCPEAHYCPQRSTLPTGCPSGTYNNRTGRAKCTTCPPGFYCPQTSISYVGMICPAGHFCLLGTKCPYQFPCPPGTFNSYNGSSSSAACLDCPPGQFCDGEGLERPTDYCSPGWYCTRRSSSDKPQPIVDYCNASHCSCPAGNYTGGKCWPGTFCPMGSSYPMSCTPGRYCADYELSSPSGLCSEGYFCSGGNKVANPTIGQCPHGHYCENGTAVPTPCPTGHFSRDYQNADISMCHLCTPGSYCSGVGNPEPSGVCDAGYYCPGGQNVSAPINYQCPRGHFCPLNSSVPLGCPSGTYQDAVGHWTCDACPAGKYCDAFEAAVLYGESGHGVIEPVDCPIGSYCPEGTESATQFLCPAGTFSNKTGLAQEQECTKCNGGHFCGSLGLTRATGLCLAGYYCSLGAEVADPNDGATGDICPPGLYCERGSVQGTKCPPGTYNNVTGLRNETECQDCPPGYFCQEEGLEVPSGKCSERYYCKGRAILPNPSMKSYGDICPAGSYCPVGTHTPFLCPIGTYLNTTGASSVSMCVYCVPGMFCDTAGQTSVTGPCSEGFYCNGGANTSTPTDGLTGDVCPAGHYCTEGTAVPSPCSNGTYMNHTQASECYICQSGFFCVNGVYPQLCPAGYYCPRGTGYNHLPCPTGSFSDTLGLRTESECKLCSAGYYCEDIGMTVESGLCAPGYYCESGVDRRVPVGDYKGLAGFCQEGTYCQEGSAAPQGCPAGTYNDLTHQFNCSECPSGHYCVANSTSYITTPCPPGHYCPPGTRFAYQHPCPPGTYNNRTLGQGVKDCLLCPPGQYCGQEGQSQPTGLCSPGYYCVRGAIASKPHPVYNSSYASDEYAECPYQPFNGTGGICPVGTYCPRGSPWPLDCPAGSYCDSVGLELPSGPCEAGFYCPGRDASPTSQECQSGHYCPEGTLLEERCTPGTFSNTVGNRAFNDCLPCTPGMYCEGYALTEPTRPCSRGYYCPGGQNRSHPLEYVCSPGFFCLGGSSDQIGCPSGTYQDMYGQWNCSECPAGSYCEALGDYIDSSIPESNLTGFTGRNRSISGVVFPVRCPRGSFCPPGTMTARERVCPPGSYSSLEGLIDESQCADCPAGFYCGEPGATNYTGSCAAGYYCDLGAHVATPNDNVTGGLCLTGQYCEAGSAKVAKNCPIGTYMNDRGASNINDCKPCTAAFYCGATGLKTPQGSGKCGGGHYCLQGSHESHPINQSYGDRCPPGHYCPTGTANPEPCPSGTYLPTSGHNNVDDCLLCDESYYCREAGQSQVTALCSAGFYCLGGANTSTPMDGFSGDVCPEGAYCPFGSSFYIDCPNGTFMNHTGAAECYICPEGYYCTIRTHPIPCPQGYFCPEGTAADWRPCPRGTFGASDGLSQEVQCTPCHGGRYCEAPGEADVTGPCLDGFYCAFGVDLHSPAGGHRGNGSVCPVGHYCPAGTTLPISCPAGEYNNVTQQAYCVSCPAGYYCPEGSVTYEDKSCPSGYYCPEGTRNAFQNSCPRGRYNPVSGAKNTSDCLLCPPGQFCADAGLSGPTGNCSAGYYCTGGSDTDTPLPVTNDTLYVSECSCDEAASPGGRCWPGSFCPEGSSCPVSCTSGMYCEGYGLSKPTDLCDAGYYCAGGSSDPRPPQGLCPPGHYCIEGSYLPEPCPIGTFSGVDQNSDVSECEPCTPGYYCDGEGLEAPRGPCIGGFYCPENQTVPNPPAYVCPAGHFCSNGSAVPVPCPPGEYQPTPQSSSCLLCPEGYFCNPIVLSQRGSQNVTYGVIAPADCSAGYFCPVETASEFEHPCPPGTYSNRTNLVSERDCLPCPSAVYCDGYGLSEPSGKCAAGYVCLASANSSRPGDGITGSQCPRGHYCPPGSITGKLCPPGTYNNGTGLREESQCTPCDAGYYCPIYGQKESSNLCDVRHYCSGGSPESNPVNETYGDLCIRGHYCPQGSGSPQPCTPGTYLPTGAAGSLQDCLACSAGSFCEGHGQFEVSGNCREGFYCVEGASTSSPTDGVTGAICPTGSYCPEGSVTHQYCPNGTYANHTGAGSCYWCPEGHYCIDGVLPLPCPEGHYCPERTGLDIHACPRGTYNNVTGLSSELQCTPCDGGMYCGGVGLTRPTGECDAGYYCHSGVNVSAPSGSVYTGIGGDCLPGHHCPAGSQVPVPCDRGLFAAREGQSHCDVCPAGAYCPSQSVNPLNETLCLPGFYCPLGTKYATQYPCKVGFYNNATGATSHDDCRPCPPGLYCDEAGLASPSDFCQSGYYCLGAATSSTPLAIGNVTDSGSGVANVTDFSSTSSCFDQFDCVCPAIAASTGGICPASYYCPIGSPEPVPCEGGQYCPFAGLPLPTGLCLPGFYCRQSSRPDQYICPAGHYCPPGTEVPISCTAGTFSPSVRNSEESDCQPCTPGEFCNGTGLVQTSGKCKVGYYCPGNQSVDAPAEYICPVGHFCVPGSHKPQVCNPGTYQDEEGKGECETCPAGHFCDPFERNGSSVVHPEDCPQGFFCLENTAHNYSACPEGNFGSRQGLQSEGECRSCPAGKFCAGEALQAPSGNCSAGFYCSGGSASATPYGDGNYINGTDNNTADGWTGNDECPVGFFCPEGSSIPHRCPTGKLSKVTQVASEDGCEDCPAGRYCEFGGFRQLREAPPCSAGFICTGGSATPTPTDPAYGYVCPPGYFCPEGAVVEQGCHLGYYNPNEGQAICTSCDPGRLCPFVNMTEPIPCTQGHYCPEGSYIAEQCPPGTFSSFTNLVSDSQCHNCSAGRYCRRAGLTAPEGDCHAGFLCKQGSDSPSPGDDGINGPCPAGHFCPEGTELEQKCPTGTFRSSTGGRNVTDCWICTGGFYCAEEGLPIPSGPCNPGYYCPDGFGSDSPTPVDFLCPKGHHCPRGTEIPLGCEAGLYQDNDGKATCKLCPAGYQCAANSTEPQHCPPQRYCPAGTGLSPPSCPAGSYSDQFTAGLARAQDCFPCPTGDYCINGQITGPCSAGYYCVSANPSPTPQSSFSASNCTNNVGVYLPNVTITSACSMAPSCDDNSSHPVIGGNCPAGYFCPEGTLSPLPCPDHTLNREEGAPNMSYCLACPAGQQCFAGNPISQACPVGHYCSLGELAPHPCPNSTYRNETGGSHVGDCFPCPPAYFCNVEGIVDFSQYPCPAGRYCPGGQGGPVCAGKTMRNKTGGADQSDCDLCRGGFYCPHPPINESNVAGVPCPPSYFCPAGAAGATLCEPGYFCPGETIDPEDCPAGYYCPNGSEIYTVCEYPHYCPNNTDVPRSCGPGYVATNRSVPFRTSKSTSCQVCLEGTYNNEEDGTYCFDCPAGYYCEEGLETHPVECPAGSYCPLRSGRPRGCPKGTYNPNNKSISQDNCVNCVVDTFNAREGQASCRPCGSSASTSGQTGRERCQCRGENRAFQVSNGACVCLSGYVFYDETDTKNSDSDGTEPCQPEVDPLCNPDEFRVASGRDCATTLDCSDSCRNEDGTPGTGQVDSDEGRCFCDQTAAPLICDAACMAQRPVYRLTINYINVAVIQVVLPLPPRGLVVAEYAAANILGSSTYDVTGRQMELLTMASGGFLGSIARDETEAEVALGITTSGSRRRRSSHSRLRRAASNGTSTATSNTIVNPIVCLVEDEALTFQLYEDNNGAVHYPIYSKDHLLNSNDQFDFGGFTQLADYVKGNVSVSSFVHIFDTAGTYVFHDSINVKLEVIVTVLPNGSECAEQNGARVLAPSKDLFVRLNVTKHAVGNTEPNWPIILGVIGTMGFIVLVLLIVVFIWKPKAAGISTPKALKPKYRRVDEPRVILAASRDDPEYTEMLLGPRGVGVGSATSDSKSDVSSLGPRLPIPGAAEGSAGAFELENFSVRTLFDKLEDQNLHVKSQLARHQQDLQAFYERISQQTENLKGMLENVDVRAVAERRRKSTSDLLEEERMQGASGGVGRRTSEWMHTRRDQREQELVGVLQDLMERIANGAVPVGPGPVLSQKSLGASGATAQPVSWKMFDQGELLRRQNAEKMQLERELLVEEAQAIEKLLKDHVRCHHEHRHTQTRNELGTH